MWLLVVEDVLDELNRSYFIDMSYENSRLEIAFPKMLIKSDPLFYNAKI
jgi:hypothetical protein